MARCDINLQRLFVAVPLAAGTQVTLPEDQSHYLVNVMRLKPGSEVLVFNGQDGEWRAELLEAKKRGATLAVTTPTRPQSAPPNIDYLFAPLKHARLDYMVQKAVEMGVKRLRPVITRRTITDRVNLARVRANAIEAAEQCGVLSVAEVAEPQQLKKVLATWEPGLPLIFCDEGGDESDPIEILQKLVRGPVALLVGPEGGFDEEERQLLRTRDFVIPLSLGPRIMRADTAAVAALALVNATLGDWR